MSERSATRPTACPPRRSSEALTEDVREDRRQPVGAVAIAATRAARRSPRRTVNAASPPANSVRKPSRERTRTMVPNGASPPEAAPMFQEIKPTPTQSASRKPTTPSAMRVPDLWEAPSPGVRPETSTTIAPTRAARKPAAAARRPTPRDSSAPRAAGSSLSAEPTRRANSKSATASRPGRARRDPPR